MGTAVESRKTRAEMFLDRAEELRALADQLKSEEHKRLLRESANHYDKLAQIEAGGAR